MDRTAIVSVTPPYAEPIHLDEAKLHLRVEKDQHDEDDLIKAQIVAARKIAEAFLGSVLVAQTFDLFLDAFPCSYSTRSTSSGQVNIPRPPLLSVVSVKYIDNDGAQQTLAANKYTVDANSFPGRIVPAYGESWPSTRSVPSAVAVRFIAGYATPFTVTDQTNNVITPKGGKTYAAGDVLRLTNSGGSLPAGLDIETDYHVVNVSGATFKLSASSGGAAIDITTGGFGTHFIGEVPGNTRAAMKLVIHELFEHRGESIEGTIVPDVRRTAENLMWPDRIVPV